MVLACMVQIFSRGAVFLFGAFVVVFGLGNIFPNNHKTMSRLITPAVTHKPSPSVTITPTPTASPSATPTPTVEQHSGFCLSVPVLLYHHIEPQPVAQEKGHTSLNVDNGIFDQQMAYLASRGYQTISADQLVTAITTHVQVPAKSIVITIDDAYLDNYVYAYPIIQKYHLHANLMVPTGLLGNSSGANSYFSWDQLKEMVNSGSIFVYNHTWSHFPMGSGPVEKDKYEATTAQQQLQDHFGKSSPIFVYPYGSGQTVPWVMKLLRDNGFVAAFSTLGGRFQCEGNIMTLPRLHIGNAPLSAYGI